MILVCDAGGGTTVGFLPNFVCASAYADVQDAAVLEAVDQSHKIPQLRQWGPDFGKGCSESRSFHIWSHH